MQYSMFNLGGMRAGVFFVAFSTASVFGPGGSDRPRQNDRTKSRTEYSADLIHSPDPAGQHATAWAHVPGDSHKDQGLDMPQF
jgi:hypothetical protein